MGGVYGLAVTDQRHRAVFNGIWQVARRLPGERRVLLRLRRAAVDELRRRRARHRRNRHRAAAPERVRSFRAMTSSASRCTARDVRFQQSLKFGSRRSADLIAEVFNLFNRANYGSYTLQESSPRYGSAERELEPRARPGLCNSASG